MSKSTAFKWHHYEPDIILLCVRWYLTYPLSYGQVAEMVLERGLDVHHTTVFRWLQRYGLLFRQTLPTSLAANQ